MVSMNLLTKKIITKNYYDQAHYLSLQFYFKYCGVLFKRILRKTQLFFKYLEEN